jgi:hypothetical protein
VKPPPGGRKSTKSRFRSFTVIYKLLILPWNLELIKKGGKDELGIIWADCAADIYWRVR